MATWHVDLSSEIETTTPVILGASTLVRSISSRGTSTTSPTLKTQDSGLLSICFFTDSTFFATLEAACFRREAHLGENSWHSISSFWFEDRTNTMQYSHCLDTCIRCSNCHVNHHLLPILGPPQLSHSSLYQAPQTNLTGPYWEYKVWNCSDQGCPCC